jgi:hypothetical protein
MNTDQKTTIWAGMGIALILVTGFIHLMDAPSSFDDATYKGMLFVANGLGAAIAAIGIARGAKTWGWGLGTLVAGGAFVAYIISRTVGLPGLQPDVWLEPLGLASLFVEVLFVGIAYYVLASPMARRTVSNRTVREM